MKFEYVPDVFMSDSFKIDKFTVYNERNKNKDELKMEAKGDSLNAAASLFYTIVNKIIVTFPMMEFIARILNLEIFTPVVDQLRAKLPDAEKKISDKQHVEWSFKREQVAGRSKSDTLVIQGTCVHEVESNDPKIPKEFIAQRVEITTNFDDLRAMAQEVEDSKDPDHVPTGLVNLQVRHQISDITKNQNNALEQLK